MELDDQNRGGLVLAIIFAATHVAWVGIVWSGAGQAVLDSLHGYHFVANPYELAAVDPVTSLVGIVGAFVSGYVLGFVAVLLWNLFE